MIKKFVLLAVIMSLIVGFFLTTGIGFVIWKVYDGDTTQFQKAKIVEILSKESVLYYSDGTTQLGSLFGQEHRIYIPIQEVPEVMKFAIVAAEDENFYTNFGIDPKGIIRAALYNLLFQTRQGASTITQQTVKNLYGRKTVNLVTKFEEMINAFKLERMYTKDQILEFYLNQFHVTGNGRGIGVAAKYYFNKSVRDLDLVEAAFIAGSVKGPEKYNPFTKTTLAGQEKARQEAFIRKNYVLERMFDNKKISKVQYEEALKEPVPFRQGRFQFNELAINQIVSKQLSRPEILQAVGANSVDDLGSMGLQITTTIDKKIQTATQYALRENLSRMQMILHGFSPDLESRFVNIQQPELYGFYVGRIESITTLEHKTSLTLNFGLPKCTVEPSALDRVALAIDQPFRLGLKKSLAKLLNSLSVGEYVLASVNGFDPSTGSMTCDLETRPVIQGASIVLDKGQVIAMVGGFSPNEYNRAVFAQRQPGSSFKVPTYSAALQLGWSVLDPLPNLRDGFLWQGNFYFPRPDHPPKTLETTILGAGAKSENLASVWILRHLLDKLTPGQFTSLIGFLGFSGDDSSPEEALARLRQKFNLPKTSDLPVRMGILENIKADFLANNTLTGGQDRLKIFLYTLHYGGSQIDNAVQSVLRDSSLTPKERRIRLNILKNNLARWNFLAGQANSGVAVLRQAVSESRMLTETEKQLVSGFGVAGQFLTFSSSSVWSPATVSPLVTDPGLFKSSPATLLSQVRQNPSLLNSSRILLDGVVPLSLIESLNAEMAKRLSAVRSEPPFQQLYWNADFRYSLAMYYAARMVQAMGVQGDVQWVPSFPLGSNVMSLSDLSLLYQTFLLGQTYRYFNSQSQPNQLLLIKKIEDMKGNILWQPKVEEHQVMSPFYTASLLDTLRGTVTAGTAFSLRKGMILRSDDPTIDKELIAAKIQIPVFGKTGTTNNYTNGTYIGFLPYPDSAGELSAKNAYTIASYLGYDNNTPMVRGGYRVYGGAAIPAWESTALAIVKSQGFAEKLGWQNLIAKKARSIPFRYGANLVQVVVPLYSGVPLSVSALGLSVDPEDSPSETTESADPYANDYSDSGSSTFKVFLPGVLTEGGGFSVKRLVEFYSPTAESSSPESPPKSIEQGPSDLDALPLPPQPDPLLWKSQ